MLMIGDGADGPPAPLRVFYCVHLTGRDRGNTGIQRVSRNLGAALRRIARVELVPVRWCAEKATIVYAEQHFCDTMGLYDGPAFAAPARPGEPIAGDMSRACLLVPEVPHLGSHDERYPGILISLLIGDARARGLLSAVVFYDLLPLTHAHVDRPGPREVALFQSYGFAISFADLLFPISGAVEADLRGWWQANGVGEHVRCSVRTARLPEELKQARRDAAGPAATLDFVSVGTVCRRKNQVAAMVAFKAFAKRRPELKARLLVIGSVAPEVAARASFEASTSDGRVRLLGYRSDEETSRLIRRARATVFLSVAEGYGLPVAESLWVGTPCLCSDFGSVAEVAAGGGCLTVDPDDAGEVADAFERLATDDALSERLRGEIAGRTFRTWDGYAEGVLRDIEAAVEGRTRAPVEGRRFVVGHRTMAERDAAPEAPGPQRR